MDANKVKGKIVLCNESASQTYIKSIGGAGDLISLVEKIDTTFTSLIPGAFVDSSFAYKILAYVNSTK